MTDVTIKQISANKQYPLRRSVLGQGLPPDVPHKPGDDHPDTYHVGIYLGDDLVSIASLYHEPQPDTSDDGDTHWRLRGMATLPEYQGHGYGKIALNACIDHAKAHQSTRIWCNARENAIGFYHNMGFVTLGDPYDLPGHGQRWMLVLKLL